MGRSLLCGAAGFTYIGALVIVTVMGIMLGIVGQSWQTIMKREREEELIWRGIQYRNAIEKWYKPAAGQHVSTPLQELKHLVKDPRSLTTVRYLRRLYPDPVTGKDWQVVKDPNRGIFGVASTSEAKPLKQGNFPEEFKEFEGKSKYSEWQFVYKFQQPGQAGKIGTTPATGTMPGVQATPGSSGGATK